MLLLVFFLHISLLCGETYAEDEKEDHLTYLHYPHFHFAGRFRADTATLNNFPNLFNPDDFAQSQIQPSFDNWNPMGSGEWSVEAEVTHVCYSDYRCVGNLPEEPLCGADITGGGTRVPAKLVDLDPQAHKFAEVWGWKILVGDYFSADFQPAPFQYRWVKTANSSDGDAEQAAAGQSQLTNIIWNETNAETSRILQELKNKAISTSGKLSIRFNMDSFNEFPKEPYFGWGRITGTIGLTGLQSSPFTPGERILKAQRQGLQDAPFVLNKKAKKLTVDFGNSLPIMKNGSHNVSFIDQLLVAIPRRPVSDKPVSCADDLLALGVVLYRIDNWYKNSAGVTSFPPIGVLSDEEMERLENTPLVIAEVEGTWPAVQCKRILFSEATDGIQVHPFTPWVLRAEPGDNVEISFLATKFGRPSAETVIHITPFVCPKIFYEYGGPQIGTEPLPFAAQNLTTTQSGMATITFKAPDPLKARKFIDGQLYPYVYWPESNPIDPQQTCDGSNFLYLLNSYFIIRVFDRYYYQDPPTWNDDVYPIFKTYANLYPIMTLNYVDLGNYHEVTKHIFHINMTMNLPKTHPNYMPVTRDLSRDKQNMIFKWLNRPCPGEEVEDFTLDLLRQHLQTALEIEHATIPTYMTALATIKENYNTEVQDIFKQILIQEMLHLALAANLLNAVGGKPVLFSSNFLPLYPTRLPGGLMPTLQVPIEKCTIALIADIFMAIEQPSITADFVTSSEPSTPEEEEEGITPGADPNQHLKVTGEYDTKEDSSTSIKRKKCGDIPSKNMKGGHSYPDEIKPIFHKHYNTIGEFYDHILRAFTFLTNNGTNETIFSGDKSKQLSFDFPFGRYGRLIKVTDFESAKKAIQEIIREGEGSSPCNPLDWSKNNGDLSHYFLFKSIAESHKIKVYNFSDEEYDDTTAGIGKETTPLFKICHGEYFFNGSKIFFDPDGVWPMVNNPRLRKLVPGSRADVLNREFNKLYTNLLRSLEVTFNGHPDKFGDALGLMFSIDRHLKTLVRTPLEQDGDPTVGPNAGPTFEFIPD
ncbi:hypothetical protein ACROYT_G020520 [Oculina patagonica]